MFLLVIFTSLILAVTYIYYSFQYWKQRNVPFVQPSFPSGNFKSCLHTMNLEIYRDLKSKGHKFGGFYSFASPKFMAVHPQVIKTILTGDFYNFTDREIYSNEKSDPVSFHLKTMPGNQWKVMRQKLTSTFTTSKMKMMFPTLVDCGRNLEAKLLELHGEDFDAKEILGLYTTDVIGSCAYGIDCNSFKGSEISEHFNPRSFESIKVMFCLTFPKLAKQLDLSITPRVISKFILELAKTTVEHRKTSGIRRNDFLQILIDLDCLSIEEIGAQVFLFFVGGFETSSTTMTYCLFELAKNQAIQDKIRREINEVLKDDLSYEDLTKLEYLNQVIEETLRMYPVLSFLNRVCTKSYSNPSLNLNLEKGVGVNVSVYGLHHDPEYFPNPDTFNPDRFSQENRKKIVPYTYLPFGEGPRNCIGFRFGQMQTRVGLVTVLRNFRIKLSPRSNSQLTWRAFSFFLSPNEPILLIAEKIA